jgi:hypothetical protein
MEYFGELNGRVSADLMFAVADILNLDHYDGCLTVIEGHATDSDYGQCYHDDMDVTIELMFHHDDSDLEVAKTLAHEMIHACQIFRGELYMYPEYALYKGDRYPYTLSENDKPFENQAYGCETVVAREALKRINQGE